MKKILLLATALIVALTTFAAEPEYEFRSTWLTTVSNIDWPKTRANTSAKRQQQQKELTDIFDKLVANNMNAVLFQVRGRSDAFYQSSYEPWAAELAGSLGTSPGYDPLAFAIEEAHKRGLELHVWVNPFRISTTSSNRVTSSQVNSLYKAPSGKQKLQWSWVIPYNNGTFSGQIIDPGYPAARQYIINVMMEIVNNYDIDGIVMDDYFYAYGGTTNEDASSQASYFNSSSISDANGDGYKLDDWRRNNVDQVIKTLYQEIQKVKPWVRMGMGTGGVWTSQTKPYTAYGITRPSAVNGAMDPYKELYCNTVEWIKQGWVDYVNPQIYWATTVTKANYTQLCKWWDYVCEHFSDLLPNGQRVHLFPSHAAYKVYNKDDNGNIYEGFGVGVSEIKNQVAVNRENLSSGYTGSSYFSNGDFLKMASSISSVYYQQKALVPPMAWKSKTTLAAPHGLSIQGTTLSWQHASATRFVVYVYPQSVSMETAIANRSYIRQMIYGKSLDISGVNLSTHSVAVRTYDRYGVLHAAKEYASSITWVLNGGQVTQAAAVPTQEALWASFKTAAGLDGVLGELSAISTVNEISAKLNASNLNTVFGKTGWAWLKTYIKATHAAQKGASYTDSNGTTRTVAELPDNISSAEVNWRYAVSAFFKQSQYVGYPNASANFASAGKPSAWGASYQAAHGTVSAQLPDYVSTTYTIPTPTKAGATFIGWYDNPNATGNKLTTLPAGYTGKVYAIWSDTPLTPPTPEDPTPEDPTPDNPTPDEPTTPPAAGTVQWVLNGGKVTGTVAVPSQEELWSNFKTDAGITALGTLAEIAATTATTPCQKICGTFISQVTEIYAKSEWQWLKTYIKDVQLAQVGNTCGTRVVPELTDDIASQAVEWRYSTAAFFLQTQYTTNYPATADFSQLGKPSEWGSSYQAAHGGTASSLPTTITSDYTLPIPTRNGYTFIGWYDNANGWGYALTFLPAGYSGTVYAIWAENPTDVENVRPILDVNAPMYDVLGRQVDATYRGIILQNNHKYLNR